MIMILEESTGPFERDTEELDSLESDEHLSLHSSSIRESTRVSTDATKSTSQHERCVFLYILGYVTVRSM